ncbi:MAG TPA: hypothetical protein VGQ72_00005 [Pyrinomonadaceae bacterium]|jgi:hypothetical protein|nr:hypothetical protein [Pyrinomonadaceae bacterium]
MMQLKSLVLLAALILLCAASHASAQQKETYTGTIVGVGGRLGGVTRTFTLTINGRTPDSEVTRDVAILAEGGQDKLLDEIRNKDLGRFSLGGQLGRELNFVVEDTQSNGDRKFMILFERWMNLYEVRYGARSTDYPFSYVELIVDRNGHGEGTFIPAARVRFNKKNEVEVENFGIYPARLAGVRLRKS